jgi:hypothetical protein
LLKFFEKKKEAKLSLFVLYYPFAQK